MECNLKTLTMKTNNNGYSGCNLRYKRNYKDWEYRMSKEEMKK